MQGNKPWYVISAVCALCVAVIYVLWYREVKDYRPNPAQLTTAAELDAALKADPSATPGRLRVPTGVFILSFDFVKANEANITGYIWQRHRQDQLAMADDKAAAGKARVGIIFPEQVGSSSTRLDEQYRREQVNAEGEREVVIGWYFDVTVRQHFDYSK